MEASRWRQGHPDGQKGGMLMDWAWCVALIFVSLFSYCLGYKIGDSNAGMFTPTQETWLELEKFRWTHPMDGNVNEEDDAESGD